MEVLQELEASTSEVNQKLYIVLLREYPQYDALLKEIIGYTEVDHDRPIRQLQEAGRDMARRVRTVDSLYAIDSTKQREIGDLFDPTIQSFNAAKALFNGWLHDTDVRLREKESLILSGK